MVRRAEAIARRRERTESRCEQVLNAAQSCFLVEGFHRASMARIADAAGMSAGYNDAIDRRSTPAGLIEAWISQFAWWIDPDRGRC